MLRAAGARLVHAATGRPQLLVRWASESAKAAPLNSSALAVPGKASKWGAGRIIALLLIGAIPLKVASAVLPLYGVSVQSLVPEGLEPDFGAEEGRVSTAEVASQGSDRLVRDVATAAAIMEDYYNADPSPDADWSDVHQRAADKLLNLCRVNKGIYIKLGQHVAQLEYLLPQQYVDTMTATLTQAPVDPFSSVKRVVEQDLGAPLDTVFSSFDPEPIASASLAQVHRATLASTGEVVAVKVQHEGLRELSQVDIATIAALVDCVKRVFPKFEYTWLVDEIKVNLPRELDFTLEGANAERAGRNFASDPRVTVPTVHWAATSPRVLTMSFEEGCYITDVGGIRAQGLDTAEVASVFGEVFSAQIFRHGFVHADPHAGNVLVRPLPGAPSRAQLVLLDHGLYRPLDDAFRVRYARLWRALIFGDEEGIRKVSAEMGAGGMHKLFAAILTTKPWEDVTDSSLDSLTAGGSEAEKARTSSYAKQYTDEIQVILRQLPPEMLLLLKTNDCLRSVDLALGAPVNGFTFMAEDCVRAIAEHERSTSPSWGTWAATQADEWAVWGGVTAYRWGAWWAGSPPPSELREMAAPQGTAGPSVVQYGEGR